MKCVAVPDASSSSPMHDEGLVAADVLLPSLEAISEEVWRRLAARAL
jgi:hypothetical protein